jgi:hypothetical protein
MQREPERDPDLVEHYLRHRLSPDDEAAFEARYLSDPELLDELELSEKLREGFQDVAKVDAFRQPARRRPALMSWFRTPQYAVAATVLLLISVAVSTALYRRIDTGSSVLMSGTFVKTQIVPLMTVRSAGDPGPSISPAAGEQLVFLIDPGPEPYPGFTATVSRRDLSEGAEPVWRSEQLEPGYQGMLALAIPSARLPVGAYRVILEGEPGTGDAGTAPVSELRFNVEPRP